MIKIEPQGAMLIVFPLPKDETLTSGGIIAQDFQIKQGEVVEVSKEWGDRYSKGDIILFPDSEGVGKSIHYQKRNCLWINGKSFTDNGDVWGKIIKN